MGGGTSHLPSQQAFALVGAARSSRKLEGSGDEARSPRHAQTSQKRRSYNVDGAQSQSGRVGALDILLSRSVETRGRRVGGGEGRDGRITKRNRQ